MLVADFTIVVAVAIVETRLAHAALPGVPVLTFVSYRGRRFYECQNQRDTSNYMILVWL